MPRWAAKQFSGWGRVTRVESQAARPERLSDIQQAMADSVDTSLIAFGAGRSYGDQALNSAGRTIVTRRLDRFLELDEANGVLTAEAGVTFSEVIDTVLQHGFMPTVVPGTGFATLGGGLANDVHGKNHHQVGSFGQHVSWFDLRLPSGELARVDRVSQPVLFRATLGGMGLTGIAEKLAMRLHRVPSNAVLVRKYRIDDLDGFIEAFERERERSPYVVGWVDALARGRSLGRGILETAMPTARGVDPTVRRVKRIPVDFPGPALNPLSVRLFNEFYRRHVPKAGWSGVLPYQQFLFPLDTVHDWNRIYGKRGFHQFQCVVPFENGREALKRMLEEIAAMKRGSFLAVLKAMGPAGLGYLSFPMPGYTLALDFPNGPGIREFLHRLIKLTLDHGGRVYTAKDSVMTATHFQAMYPELPDFVAALEQIDPARLMRSEMAVRLGLREHAS